MTWQLCSKSPFFTKLSFWNHILKRTKHVYSISNPDNLPPQTPAFLDIQQLFRTLTYWSHFLDKAYKGKVSHLASLLIALPISAVWCAFVMPQEASNLLPRLVSFFHYVHTKQWHGKENNRPPRVQSQGNVSRDKYGLTFFLPEGAIGIWAIFNQVTVDDLIGKQERRGITNTRKENANVSQWIHKVETSWLEKDDSTNVGRNSSLQMK